MDAIRIRQQGRVAYPVGPDALAASVEIRIAVDTDGGVTVGDTAGEPVEAAALRQATAAARVAALESEIMAQLDHHARFGALAGWPLTGVSLGVLAEATLACERRLAVAA